MPDDNNDLVPPGPEAAAARTGPFAVIGELAKTHPQASSILLAGIASFAAVLAVTRMGIDLESTVPSVVYVVGIGLALLLLSSIVGDKILFLVLRWCTVILGIIWVIVYFLHSTALPDTYFSRPQIKCALLFWRECAETADKLADQSAIAEQPLAISEPGPAVVLPARSGLDPAQYDVFVQFAGSIRREDIRDMMTQLAGAGWDMQGIAGGGQRIDTAVGILEIRYGPQADMAAADLLAQSIFASGRVSRLPDIVANQGIAAGSLEVWIGRDFGISTANAKVALTALGFFNGPINGEPDPDLGEAIEAFQRSAGLVPDGLIGPVTLGAMLDRLPPGFSFSPVP